MIAAAALRDVVEQRREVEHLGPREVAHEPAAQRKLVRELGDGEAPQVAHHVQDVLVDRVDVVEIVLHLADDAAERRQVAAEHAVLVHAPQRPLHAGRAAQDAQEALAVARDRARNARLIAGARATARAGCRRADAFQLVVLLQQQEGLEHRAGLALEQPLVARLPAARRACRSAR